MKLVLIDTNILIYALEKSSVFHKKSVDILTSKKYKHYISTKNIAELFAVCLKKEIHKEKIISYLHDTILNTCILIYPNKQSFYQFINLMSKYNVKGNRVYDIEIVSIMLANGIDTIATFNNKDFININEIQILKECL